MTVVLVGAGPGDPDLLTLRAEAALASATLVAADEAVIPLAQAFAPGARVAPAPADPGALVDLLAPAAAAVRLYRGDPWLHPSFAAESAGLAARGVTTEAVPAPPVETALAGAAGVPAHHRPLAVTLTLGTAVSPGPGRTVAVELPDLAAACERLGADDTPAAAVPAGGSVLRATLAELAAVADLQGEPGLLVLGPTTLALGAG
jgi:uroporphyrinogen III methyltransferase/synthase